MNVVIQLITHNKIKCNAPSECSPKLCMALCTFAPGHGSWSLWGTRKQRDNSWLFFTPRVIPPKL